MVVSVRVFGEVPERSKGADCKSVGYAFEGSNPSLPRGSSPVRRPFFNLCSFYGIPVMQKSFYKDGLQFECTQCSTCCRFDPGYVFISLSDLNTLTAFIHISRDRFIKKFCRIVTVGDEKRLSLKEKTNYDCIFWKFPGGCTVYEARPFQCRSYPFWSACLRSDTSWSNEALSCPGINTGHRHTQKNIEEWMKKMDNKNYLLEDIL